MVFVSKKKSDFVPFFYISSKAWRFKRDGVLKVWRFKRIGLIDTGEQIRSRLVWAGMD
jgi:hypothetical protein